MNRHTIMIGIMAWILLFSSIGLNGQRAVAVQANTWLELPVWTEVSYEQTELVASANAQPGPPAPSLQKEKRIPTEKETTREGFVLEPIHLLLLGSALIGLGVLRNRHKKV